MGPPRVRAACGWCVAPAMHACLIGLAPPRFVRLDSVGQISWTPLLLYAAHASHCCATVFHHDFVRPSCIVALHAGGGERHEEDVCLVFELLAVSTGQLTFLFLHSYPESLADKSFDNTGCGLFPLNISLKRINYYSQY